MCHTLNRLVVILTLVIVASCGAGKDDEITEIVTTVTESTPTVVETTETTPQETNEGTTPVQITETRSVATLNSVPVAFSLACTDDPHRPVTSHNCWRIVTAPQKGTLIYTEEEDDHGSITGHFTYTPDDSLIGTDTFVVIERHISWWKDVTTEVTITVDVQSMPQLFAVDLALSSTIYHLDTHTGAETIVAETGYQLTDIASDGAVIYGVTYSDLITVDPTDGTVSYVGATGFSSVNALVYHDGTLYGATGIGEFITIDPTTGTGTLIGYLGTGVSSGDLAVTDNGTLYATLNVVGSTNDYLAIINTRTGEATLIGDTGFRSVYGLVYEDGLLYGLTFSSEVILLNTTTGEGTLIHTPPRMREYSGGATAISYTSATNDTDTNTTIETVVTTIQPGTNEGKDTCWGTIYVDGITQRCDNVEEMYIGGWGDYYYNYLEFELADAPSASNTESVVLHLYFLNEDHNDPAFEVHRITQEWAESTVTRNNHPSSIYYKEFGSSVTTNGWYTVDITDLYKAWKDGTNPNYGIKLVPTNNNQSNGFLASSEYIDATKRPKLVITSTSAVITPFLQFPLHSSGYTPYDTPVTAVFDHDDTIGSIRTYTGEVGSKTDGCLEYVQKEKKNVACSNENTTNLRAYKKFGGSAWITPDINYHDYASNSGKEYMWYDNHSGYDYAVGRIPVTASASGIIEDINATYGQVTIDHGNGYRTFYTHMDILSDLPKNVIKGQIIGTVSDVYSEGSVHLHFTVKKSNGNDLDVVDPYGGNGMPLLWE